MVNTLPELCLILLYAINTENPATIMASSVHADFESSVPYKPVYNEWKLRENESLSFVDD